MNSGIFCSWIMLVTSYLYGNQNDSEMKKPQNLEDVKAYAFGFFMIGVAMLTPFALIAILKLLVQ